MEEWNKNSFARLESSRRACVLFGSFFFHHLSVRMPQDFGFVAIDDEGQERG